MAKIVIIGAGLTGLSAAYHLEKKGYFDYKIFEKDAGAGGLCRSVVHDGFTFDYTGHLLHIGDSYFQSLISSLVGMEHFNSINRRSFIYSHNVYTHYPFQINLFGLPPEVVAECIEGFVLRKKIGKKDSFYNWALAYFGKGIARNFFFPYQKKIFAYDIKKITSTWTGRFVPSTSLTQMIQGAIKDPTETVGVGYNAHFYYPKQGGIFFWVNKIARALKNPIKVQYEVEKIDLKSKTVLFTNGEYEKFETLISTMPLDHLLARVSEKSTTHFAQQQKKLICNSVINFNIGVKRTDLSDKHWIYFPENNYPFYRIGFPHNFSQATVPAGCSSLYGELSYINKSKKYCNALLTESLRAAKTLLHIKEQDIVTEKIITIPHAYVIYDFWRERNLPKLLKRLQDNDIYSIGRYGAWKYSSMQEAVLDGKKVADELIVMPATKAYFVQPPEYSNQKELG